MAENIDVGDSKGKILEAATTEFAQYGLAGARIDRIAESAGINKAMIYYHFHSKENLYQAIINQQISSVAEKLAEHFADGVSLEEALLLASEQHHNLLAPNSRFRAIFLHEIAAGAGHLKQALLRIVTQRGLPRTIFGMLEDGKREGRFRDVDSRQVMLAFIGMNFFYLLAAPVANMIWEIDNEEEFRQKRPAALVDLFLHGVEKHV
jgi:TetR/AcrR family transcriptional regulator